MSLHGRCFYYGCQEQGAGSYLCCSSEHGFRYAQNRALAEDFKSGKRVWKDLYNLVGISRIPWSVKETEYYANC